MTTVIRWVLCLVVFSLAAPVAARAQDTDGAVLSQAEIEHRLSFIGERLERGRAHARAWQFGWTAVFAGNIAANAIGLADQDGDEQVARGVSIAKSSLGLFRNLLEPLPQRAGAEPLRDAAANDGDPLTRLARGEALLAASAQRARRPFRLAPHLGILGVNLLGGLIIVAAGDDSDAALSVASGVVGGELRLWSQPSRAAGDLQAYEHRFGGRATDARWRILPAWRGLMIELKF